MRIIPVVVTAALLATTACGTEPEQTSVRNDADLIAAALEAKADNLEAQADSDANADAAALLKGAADNFEAQADDVRDIAENADDSSRR